MRERAAGKATLAYERLKEEILSGALLPGDRLVERDLSERLGISKTPVREALARLKSENLASSSSGGWMQVASWSLQEFVEMYQVREVLEGLATRLTAERQQPEVCDELRTLMRKFASTPDDDSLGFYGLNLEFHSVFKNGCGNTLLAQTLEPLYTRNRLMFGNALNRLLMANKIGAQAVLEEHQSIVDAVLQGDGQLAEQAARMHIRSACTRLIGERRNEFSIFLK